MVEFIEPLSSGENLIDRYLRGFFPPFTTFPPAFNDLSDSMTLLLPEKSNRSLSLTGDLDRYIYAAGQDRLPPNACALVSDSPPKAAASFLDEGWRYLQP